MSRNRSVVAGMLVGVLLPVAAAAGTFIVEMTTVDGEPRFVPETVSIRPGDTVRWLNTDLHLEHSVSSGTGSADPLSGSLWSSPLLRLGEYFEHTFPDAGEFEYYSVPHEYEGMFGLVQVSSTTGVGELEASTWGRIKQRFADLLPRR
jgi:plastocyanin